MWIILGVCGAVFVMAIVVAGAWGLFDGGMPDDGEERAPGHRLPEGFGASDVERLGFTPAVRGYRMDEVDEVLRVLAARIRELEAEAARREDSGGSATDSSSAAAPSDGTGAPAAGADSTHA
ncbi:hypothetical protein GCM10009755_08660 [Brevibacterium samyangense]|uniref:DivIVA domain-containing protein n=2 Tax=Brevibacterium samyangense TaxID=366888 RepID=A0ABP5EQE6_9MICO